MQLKLLSPTTINRIAAGEVIERPASVVKELVENSIDAGATEIDIIVHNGGRNLVSVADNGKGMTKDELKLCLQRHATSKLSDDDLFDIAFLGFRGEAIPSIGSVSRMTITSRKQNADEGWSVFVNGGEESDPIPASIVRGTKIEVRDLFFATPARLKFLKTERTENIYISEVVNKLAMAYPHVGFNLQNEKRTLLKTQKCADGNSESLLKRLSDILGRDFEQNSIKIDAEREGLRLKGYIGLPTYNKGSAASQFVFVNNRPVKDKVLIGAIRAAYQDFLARDRYPVVALSLDIDNEEVDVNVHPTKAEVRFRDAGMVRGLIVASLKNALSGAGHRASTTVSSAALGAFKPQGSGSNVSSFPRPSYSDIQTQFAPILPKEPAENNLSDKEVTEFKSAKITADRYQPQPQISSENLFKSDEEVLSVKPQEMPSDLQYVQPNNYPLGLARCQLHKTYIVSQTDKSIVIVDQHAAHERLVYENMKLDLAKEGVKTQRLLIPEIVEISELEVESLLRKQEELAKLGLVIEKFSEKSVIVRETPALLGEVDAQGLVKSLVNDIAEYDEILSANEALEHVCGTMACHGSVRSGRILNVSEMNSILRQMEQTPYSGQCNHGRPTYVELSLHEVEKLFGRK